jgi:exodeoxyribonuclease-5
MEITTTQTTQPPVEEIVLTADQELALQVACRAIDAGGVFLLAGYAGTGKSFLCKLLAKRYPKALFTAPTNKAAKVLSKDMGVPACTIHSALGLQLKHGKLQCTKRVYFNGYDVVVIDEGSMVNQEVYDHIMEKITPHCAVLFIGDPCQLPPVKEKMSPVFEINDHVELTDIVRQGKDNPIIAYSVSLRDEGFSERRIPVDGKSILKVTPKTNEEWLDLLIQNYSDGGVYAAWTNAVVDAANLGVHMALYGEDATEYMPGETIVLNAPWVVEDFTILGHTGDEFTVKSVERVRRHKLNAWLITVVERTRVILGQTPEEEAYEEADELLVVADESKAAFKAQLDEIAKTKDWRLYYEVKERFHDISHTYAFTCHKLQGSTYNNVMVDVMDITKNPKTGEMNRCMYVAITRTRNRVTFVC